MRRGRGLVALLGALALGCAVPGPGGDGPRDAAAEDPEQYQVVDCLLPPQMIRQGEASVRFTPSRPIKTSARSCARQGGARKAGLEAWKQLADSGNAEAQVYLGEMFEHGTGGVQRDLRVALDWYTRAAAQKNARAISNLALLYAHGAPGLTKDPQRAADLVRQSAAATGVDTRNLSVVAVPRAGPRRIELPAEGLPRDELRGFAFGNYHALLIGNGEYRHLPRLRSPTNEVDVIGRLLETRYGFRVTKLKNATRDQILRKLDDLDAVMKEEDNLLVYYSGHGAESETGEGYWIPVDGEAPGPGNQLRTRLWVPTSDLREKLAVLKSDHVFVVSDSCYSGRLLQFRGGFAARPANPGAGIPASTSYLESFARNYGARSRMALTSGGLAPVIEPNDGSNLSLFAKALIQFLERGRDPFRSVDIFAGIQQDVVLATSRIGFTQEPQWGAIGGGGHESGDFWFRPR